jgi:uncharacterized protein YpbB
MNKNLLTYYEEMFRYNKTEDGVRYVSHDGVNWMSLRDAVQTLSDSNDYAAAFFDTEIDWDKEKQ